MEQDPGRAHVQFEGCQEERAELMLQMQSEGSQLEHSLLLKEGLVFFFSTGLRLIR